MIETIRQGLKEDGLAVPVSKLCRWIGVPLRTVYYRPTKKWSCPYEAEQTEIVVGEPGWQLLQHNLSGGSGMDSHIVPFEGLHEGFGHAIALG